MSELEKAAAAAVASWDCDGARYDAFCQRMEALRAALAQQAEPVAVQAEPVDVRALAAQAGLPLAWISETGVIQWSQLERLIALATQQAEPVQSAVLEEREACARQLDALGCDHCAAAIRARGKK